MHTQLKNSIPLVLRTCTFSAPCLLCSAAQVFTASPFLPFPSPALHPQRLLDVHSSVSQIFLQSDGGSPPPFLRARDDGRGNGRKERCEKGEMDETDFSNPNPEPDLKFTGGRVGGEGRHCPPQANDFFLQPAVGSRTCTGQCYE